MYDLSTRLAKECYGYNATHSTEHDHNVSPRKWNHNSEQDVAMESAMISVIVSECSE